MQNKTIGNITNINNYFFSFLFLILVVEINQKLFNNHFCFINFNNSFITLTIKGIGYKSVFSNNNEFETSYHPNEVYINGDKQDSVNYSYYLNETYNYVKLVWYNNIEDPSHMFAGCSDITEIDLSNFNTSETINMCYMFTDCISITSLNLSNFDTSKVSRMFDMFRNCSSLTSLDLSSFDTSNVETMKSAFQDCISLSSLDLSNFITPKVGHFAEMFKGCKNLEYINFKNFNGNAATWSDDFFNNVPVNIVICVNEGYKYKITSYLSNSNCYVIDCSDDWKSKRKMINNENGQCINTCNDKKYYNIKCYDDCPSGILLNNDNSEIIECKCELEQCLTCPPVPLMKNMCTKCNYNYYEIENDENNIGEYINCYKDPEGYYLDINASLYKKCYYKCKTCEIKGYEETHNCLTCSEEFPVGINFNESNNYTMCYEKCYNYYFFDCDYNYHCLINSSYPNEYPKEIKEIIFQKENITCLEEVPENYYFDNIDNIYKECYYSCKICGQRGNTINNCDKCKNNYTFLNESFIPSQNCLQKCNYYYYFNEDNQYTCTESNICPTQYNKLVNEKNKCIDKCIKDDTYIYEYNNSCLKECPEGIKIYEEEKKCLDSCYDYLFEYQNICYNDCPNNTYRIFQNRNICAIEVPENYYLDNNDGVS
jgi:surface protein